MGQIDSAKAGRPRLEVSPYGQVAKNMHDQLELIVQQLEELRLRQEDIYTVLMAFVRHES